MKEKLLAAVVAVSLILLEAACGGGGSAGPTAASPTPSPSPSPVVLGAIDPALVGTWTGSMCCAPFGASTTTLTLNADGTTWFEGSGRYCRAHGRWGVSGREFTAIGGDCTGTNITLIAPVSSATLAGNYSTSGGVGGTFSVTKQ